MLIHNGRMNVKVIWGGHLLPAGVKGAWGLWWWRNSTIISPGLLMVPMAYLCEPVAGTGSVIVNQIELMSSELVSNMNPVIKRLTCKAIHQCIYFFFLPSVSFLGWIDMCSCHNRRSNTIVSKQEQIIFDINLLVLFSDTLCVTLW